MFRLLVALAALFLVAVTPTLVSATPTRNDYFLNIDNVRQIVCTTLPPGVSEDADPTKLSDAQLEKLDVYTGSGTIIGRNRVLTAAHVIHGASYCFVGKVKAKISFEDTKLDMAILDVPLGSTAVTQIACDGFVKDRVYFPVGFAWGADFAMQLLPFSGFYVNADLDGTKAKHLAEFAGPVFGGMSGGPVVGTDGRIYGIVIASDGEHSSLFRDLQDTPLCAALLPAPIDLSKLIVTLPPLKSPALKLPPLPKP
jgi:hypothetical protein